MRKLFTFITTICLFSILIISGCIEEEGQINPDTEPEITLSFIQDLINNASSGDTVIIPMGTYYENITINKSIILEGEDEETTIIDGSVEITTDAVTISNFTIKNGTGISIIGSTEVTIHNNVVKENKKGVSMSETSLSNIYNNVIEDNEEEGIYFYNSFSNTIYKNTIENNAFGIYLTEGETNRFNLFYSNNLIDNTENAYDAGNNEWYVLAIETAEFTDYGNYWSDYTEKYPEASSTNGTWNISYDILGGINNDSCPSVEIINEKPTAGFSFSPLSPTTGEVIQLDDVSEDSDGYIISWEWDFGDGNISTSINPKHTYLDNGNYVVSLSVTDNLNETETKSKTITILNIEPTADFSTNPTNPYDVDNISFIDHSTDPDGIIVSWGWNFGDGNISTEKNASHIYADDGSYSVKLTVTDDDGATNTIQKDIQVSNVKPNVGFSFTPDKPTIEDTVQFTGSFSDSDGEVVSFIWNFDDGTTSLDQNPTHRYDEGKTYQVVLTVVDDDGASNSFTRYVKVSADYSSDGEDKGHGIIYVIFFIFFIITIVFVYYMYRKFQDK